MSPVRISTERSSVSQSVVEAIAEAEGVDPTEVTPPLYSAIDPTALDEIFTSTPTTGREGGRVVFTYEGYEVTVSGDGYVSVAERDE